MIKPIETFHINPPVQVKEYWLIGILSLEVYNSIFNMNTTNKNFEFYTYKFDEFSFEELKDELDEIFNISDFTPYHLQHEKIGPHIIEAYKKLLLEKKSTDGSIILLKGFARYLFRDSESDCRVIVGLNEDGIQLILKQYNSNFVTYELSPGIYTIKDNSEAVYTMDDHEGILRIE